MKTMFYISDFQYTFLFYTTYITNICHLALAVEMVKKTWANMRDYFRKELKNVPLTTTGMTVVDKYNNKWPYWKALLFLVPVLHPRSTEGNCSLIEELVVEQDEEHKLDLVALGPTASGNVLSGIGNNQFYYYT